MQGGDVGGESVFPKAHRTCAGKHCTYTLKCMEKQRRNDILF